MEYGGRLWKLRQEGYRRFHPGLYNETISAGGGDEETEADRKTYRDRKSLRERLRHLSQLLIY